MAAAPEGFDLLRQCRIDFQLKAEEAAHRIQCEVVTGGAETAGDDDGVGGPQRVAQRGGDFGRMIPRGQLQNRTESRGGEAAAEKTRVGIEDAPFQEFRAGGKNGNAHG